MLQADFRRLNMGIVIITWGPEVNVRQWCKHLVKHIEYPILWDQEMSLVDELSFRYGCAAV